MLYQLSYVTVDGTLHNFQTIKRGVITIGLRSRLGRTGGGEVLLNVLRCQLTYWGQVVTNAEARFNNSLRPRKPEGSLGRRAPVSQSI